MQSDLEKMQEELDTQDQLRKQQEEQVEHKEHLFIASDFLLFVPFVSVFFVCVPAHKTGRDVKEARAGGHRAQISTRAGNAALGFNHHSAKPQTKRLHSLLT